MPAQPHKRRARGGGKGLMAAAFLCVIGLTSMVLGYAWMGPQTVEPNRDARQLVRTQGRGPVPGSAAAMASQPALTPGISPEHARARLADMAPLRLPTHGPASDEVKTTLLCFCLLKGPQTVRELRRLAAEKFVRGIVAFEDAKYQAAADAFGQAIQRHPREARAFVNRGLAYAHLQRYQEAKADLTQAIALHETLAEAYYGRGLIAIFTGDADGAKADMLQAAQLGDERALRLLPAGTQPVRGEGSERLWRPTQSEMSRAVLRR
jgi:tetratricopeptide (TPR) repeat protein